MLSRQGFAPMVWPGFTPYEISKLVFDRYFFERLADTQWPQVWRVRDIDDGPGWLAIFSILSLARLRDARGRAHLGLAASIRDRRRPGAAAETAASGPGAR